ncbi:LpxL/LpxP family Kdo(2)-lipid IV(A) lauroyl/palmitoleoyl acyltransferase [Candidatus Thioglobus sp. NP1]|uniref:LpxL/LpxP family Kdo(2)-lipid IV(A) lauroyl/palmitoleoyl acyltransferase n=1 Tax=Candidatus Thioglobus sp. NP1 TaxID=2508687 RepID=UPI000DEDAB15|nr:LpxL/LpxP family Kdo(2)-lipid IV(A) lauroyl/palmitoleoyl acyltransferase [Candidatus Thioglobus sp. NP1]AXE62578.1 lipid A biosynthesis acyltransferase [Candidatus Thioglobus sp. NP1]
MLKIEFIHPKFYPTWILILLMRIGVFIPFQFQVILGKVIGKLIYPFMKKLRKTAYSNISNCFPEKKQPQVTLLVKQHFDAIGISLFETANAYYGSDRKIKKLLSISNKHFFSDALKDEGGIILLCSHFMPLMLGSRALLLENTIANVYRPQNNKLFDKVMVKGYTRNGAVMIKSKDTRSILKAIKNSLPIWYAPDQDLGINNSVFAPLFGIETATASATARLAKNNNTRVIPYSFIRTKHGYEMSFDKPIKNYPSNDPIKDATTTNKILENQIIKAPEQYLWIHRRFKTRPDGQENFYNDM